VEIARARLYWPGDVVAFRNADGGLIVHRLLGYRPRVGPRARGIACVTRGDAAPLPDAPVPLGSLLGRIVRVETRRAPLVTPADRVRAVRAFLGLAAASAGRLLRR
jgi:hypothetical protein